MPRPEPRPGWRLQPHTDAPKYTDDQGSVIVRAIEAPSGSPLSDERKDDLLYQVQLAASAYYEVKHQQAGPTKAQSKKALEELKKAAEDLQKKCVALDDASMTVLAWQGGRVNKLYRRFGPTWPTEAPSLAASLVKECNCAIARFQEGTPPSMAEIMATPPDLLVLPFLKSESAVSLFVGWLADAFLDFTSKEPKVQHDRASEKYKGHFLEFVSAALIPLEEYERSSLGRTAFDALIAWRKERKNREADA